MNGKSHEEKLTNLAILIDNDATGCHTIVDLPKNDNVSKILNFDKHQEPTDIVLSLIVTKRNLRCKWSVVKNRRLLR